MYSYCICIECHNHICLASKCRTIHNGDCSELIVPRLEAKPYFSVIASTSCVKMNIIFACEVKHIVFLIQCSLFINSKQKTKKKETSEKTNNNN